MPVLTPAPNLVCAPAPALLPSRKRQSGQLYLVQQRGRPRGILVRANHVAACPVACGLCVPANGSAGAAPAQLIVDRDAPASCHPCPRGRHGAVAGDRGQDTPPPPSIEYALGGYFECLFN